MNKLLILFSFIVSINVLAAKPIALSGRIQDLSNNPIENSNTIFKVTISNSLDCILYQEQHILDMTGTSGYYKINIFSGNPIFNTNGSDIFVAKQYICQNLTNWIATQNDTRKVSISVKVGSDPWVDFASDVINSVSYANEAEYVKGKTITDFVQINATTTQNKIDQVMSQYNSIMDLINGLNTTYAKQSYVDSSLSTKQNSIAFTPMNPSNNLSELTNKALARSNLNLGALSILNAVSNTEITSVDWTKIINKPSTYSPSAHSHPISDITNLTSTLNSKVDKSSFVCGSTQTVIWISATDSFQCQDITLTGDITGIAALNSITKIQGKTLSISNPSNNDFIYFNSSTNRWENKGFSSLSINTTGDITANNLIANKQIAGKTVVGFANATTLDFTDGNTIVLSNNCASTLNLLGMKDGGVYTFVNLDTATTAKCQFTATDISGAIFKFSPANAARTSGMITVYSILRAGNYLLVSWSSSFE